MLYCTVHCFCARVQSPTYTTYRKCLQESIMTMLTPKSGIASGNVSYITWLVKMKLLQNVILEKRNFVEPPGPLIAYIICSNKYIWFPNCLYESLERRELSFSVCVKYLELLVSLFSLLPLSFYFPVSNVIWVDMQM